MPSFPTSTGPFVWSGPGGAPPNNINEDDYILASKTIEIKDNADWLHSNTEYCFNEKLDYYANRDTIKEINLYSTLYTTRRDTEYESKYDNAFSLDKTDNYVTLYSGKCDNACVAYLTARYVYYKRSQTAAPGYYRRYYSDNRGNYSNYKATVNATDHVTVHTTYHSGAQTAEKSTVKATNYASVNSTNHAVQHSARHTSLCSILDGP